jgi:hypothetical protein
MLGPLPDAARDRSAVDDVEHPTLKQAALDLARRDIAVFPSRAKKPLTARGQLTDTPWSASADPAVVARMPWARADCISRPTGHGLVVIDVDPGGVADPTWGEPTVRTPRGGEHYYFAGRSAVRYRTLACTPAMPAVIPGRPHVDVRADNGQVVAPPSGGYTWLSQLAPEGPFAPLPDDLHELLRLDERSSGGHDGAVERWTRANPCPICKGHPQLKRRSQGGNRCYGYRTGYGTVYCAGVPSEHTDALGCYRHADPEWDAVDAQLDALFARLESPQKLSSPIGGEDEDNFTSAGAANASPPLASARGTSPDPELPATTKRSGRSPHRRGEES